MFMQTRVKAACMINQQYKRYTCTIESTLPVERYMMKSTLPAERYTMKSTVPAEQYTMKSAPLAERYTMKCTLSAERYTCTMKSTGPAERYTCTMKARFRRKDYQNNSSNDGYKCPQSLHKSGKITSTSVTVTLTPAESF